MILVADKDKRLHRAELRRVFRPKTAPNRIGKGVEKRKKPLSPQGTMTFRRGKHLSPERIITHKQRELEAKIHGSITDCMGELRKPFKKPQSGAHVVNISSRITDSGDYVVNINRGIIDSTPWKAS